MVKCLLCKFEEQSLHPHHPHKCQTGMATLSVLRCRDRILGSQTKRQLVEPIWQPLGSGGRCCINTENTERWRKTLDSQALTSLCTHILSSSLTHLLLEDDPSGIVRKVGCFSLILLLGNLENIITSLFLLPDYQSKREKD